MRGVGIVLLGACLSGVLLNLCLPLGEHGSLAWFALVPVILAVRERRLIVGVLAALVCVGVAAGLAVSGIVYAHRVHGDPIVVFGSCGKFAIVLGIVLGASADREAWRRPAWFFAALAVLAEALQLVDLPVHLALSQYRHLALLQLASVGGIWLVSFIVWWANFALARLRWKSMLLASAGLATMIGLTSSAWPPLGGPFQRFAVVQAAEPDEAVLMRLHFAASAAQPQFVVWPEFAGMSFVGATDKPLAAVSGSPRSAPLITSFRDSAQPLPHNVSALFDHGVESPRYAKRKLFGGERTMHASGDKPVAVTYRGGAVGLCICFDSCFPQIIRETAALPNVDVIALPTIDPPSANCFMAGMHAAYTPFRCAESGVAMVRGDGNANSQLVDASGRIVREMPPGDGYAGAEMSVQTRLTPYRRFGDWFLVVAGALAVVGWARGLRKPTPPEARGSSAT